MLWAPPLYFARAGHSWFGLRQTYLTHKYHNLLQLEAKNGRAGIALLAPPYDNKAKKQTKSYQIYHTDLESLEDYLTRLKSGECGDTLYTTLATSDGYKTAAKALQKSGFSEDPDYASKLIAVIESENLTQYD
ncbi:glucosaminidase domain-containing protein [Streptococcus caprae]|uniref:Glucosaminidase domain-containing protein n=1 Tax=Streptococcus caprae TaxID=1640501 RepID=A0ABV8CUI2_9STRE